MIRSMPFVLLLVAACAGGGASGEGWVELEPEAQGQEAPAGQASLAGTRWLLEDLSGAGVIDDAQATLEFAEDGRVSGSATCNRFTGTATISGDSISFGPLAATRRMCPEALMLQETNYLAALSQVKQYDMQGSTLFLHVGGGSEPLRFTEQ